MKSSSSSPFVAFKLSCPLHGVGGISNVRLFLEEAEKLGTLEDILDESKFRRDPSGRWVPPKLVATELVSTY